MNITYRSAARRNRLDGNTFKLLNFGTLISFLGVFSMNLFYVYSQKNLKPIIVSSILLSALGVIFPASILFQYKLPSLKYDFSNLLSTTYLVRFILLKLI